MMSSTTAIFLSIVPSIALSRSNFAELNSLSFKLKAGLTSKNKSKLGYYMDKVAYKLRQIVLAKRLNSTFQKQVKKENPNLSNSEEKKEMKKKVLELYLNYIEF